MTCLCTTLLTGLLLACRQMNWDNVNPYEYHPERGLYWHEITPNLLCGSQPQSAGDVDILHCDMEVTDIISLQQDKDLDYWGVNLQELMHQADERQLHYRRCPVGHPALQRKLASMACALTQAGSLMHRLRHASCLDPASRLLQFNAWPGCKSLSCMRRRKTLTLIP